MGRSGTSPIVASCAQTAQQFDDVSLHYMNKGEGARSVEAKQGHTGQRAQTQKVLDGEIVEKRNRVASLCQGVE